MKRNLVALLFLSLTFAGFAQRTVNLITLEHTKGIKETIPKRDIVETNDGVIITYHFQNITLQDDPLYSKSVFAKIDGFWPNNNEGEPAVLKRWDTFAVPNNNAKVVVLDSTYVEIPIDLSPARPILSNGGMETYTERNVKPISRYSGYFPSKIIPAVRFDCYREQQLLDVCISPLQYDYLNKKVRAYSMIRYKIQYDVSALKNSIFRFIESNRDNTFLNNIALNVPLSDAKSTVSTGYVSNKYLIVSVPKYAIAVNRFAEWKRTLGFDVQVAIQETWDTASVKTVVSNAYVANKIKYLLIFGGQNDVPALIRDKIFNSEHHYHPTDLYYGCVSMQNSYTPDIFRGRILVNTPEEAMVVVSKIIDYERNPVTDSDFYNTGVHCAYFQEDPLWTGYEGRRFVLTSERIRDRMLSIKDSIHRVYYTESTVNPTHWNKYIYANGEAIPVQLTKPTFAWDGGSSDISSHINQKAFYVCMRDHGEVDEWYRPHYTNSDIEDLHNGNHLPVVFSICCLTGRFTCNNCFCETFLKKNDGGCVAIYGATDVSLSGPNDVMAEGMFDAIWPSTSLHPQFGMINGTSYSPTPTPTYRLGQILDQGLKRCDEAYFNTYGAWYPRYTSELFHCFGDPSMMIYTEVPQTFSCASITRQTNGTIFADTGGVLATITFYNRRTGEIVSYLGYSKSYQGNPETSVCISAHNMIPYIDAGIIYIQNQTLADGGYFDAQKIMVGKNVTSTQTQGDVNFSQGDYHLVGEDVELHPGTTISIGSSLQIENK